jgi:hypothetical protein
MVHRINTARDRFLEEAVAGQRRGEFPLFPQIPQMGDMCVGSWNVWFVLLCAFAVCRRRKQSDPPNTIDLSFYIKAGKSGLSGRCEISWVFREEMITILLIDLENPGQFSGMDQSYSAGFRGSGAPYFPGFHFAQKVPRADKLLASRRTDQHIPSIASHCAVPWCSQKQSSLYRATT